MPFDALTLPRSLKQTAQDLGITPIPQQVLAFYKQQQRNRYPGSWWYRYGDLGAALMLCTFALALTTCGGCLLAYVATGITALAVISSAGFAILFLLGLSGALSRNGLMVKGPAFWVEYEIGDPEVVGVPAKIAARAKQIIDRMPDARLIIGDLRQENISLDPYLVVRYEFEQIVLGIWDEGGIIMEATEDGWHIRR